MRGLGPFLRDAWRLARPYFAISEERWSARGLLVVIIALNLSLVGMSVVLNFWNRAIYNSLQDKDWHSFIELLFWYRPATDQVSLMPGFCEIAVVYIIIAVYRTYLRQWLQIRWRRWLTEHYIDRWLGNRAYYRINLMSAAAADGAISNGGVATDNPDQRIADDLDRFTSDSLVLTLDLLSNVVTLFSFLSILWTLSGSLQVMGFGIPGYMVWVALVYSIAGTWLTHLIGRPLAMLNFNQQRLEANFRFALVRLRENVEGVALYKGEQEEHRGLAARFAAVVGNWWAIMQRTKKLNAFVAGLRTDRRRVPDRGRVAALLLRGDARWAICSRPRTRSGRCRGRCRGSSPHTLRWLVACDGRAFDHFPPRDRCGGRGRRRGADGG